MAAHEYHGVAWDGNLPCRSDNKNCLGKTTLNELPLLLGRQVRALSAVVYVTYACGYFVTSFVQDEHSFPTGSTTLSERHGCGSMWVNRFDWVSQIKKHPIAHNWLGIQTDYFNDWNCYNILHAAYLSLNVAWVWQRNWSFLPKKCLCTCLKSKTWEICL